jgi:hypothetical protein
VVTFINGLTASVVASPRDWPAARQIAQLRLQLELLHGWAGGDTFTEAAPRRARRTAVATA